MPITSLFNGVVVEEKCLMVFPSTLALVADLTGDGKNDLAVVVHDRILVYPQE